MPPLPPAVHEHDRIDKQSAAATLAYAVRPAAVRADPGRALPSRIRARDADAPGRGGRHRRQQRAADVRQHDCGARPQRPRSRAHRAAVLQPGGIRDVAGAAGRRARNLAAARRALQRDPPARRAFRAHRRAVPAARRAPARAGAAAAHSSASTSISCARARGFPAAAKARYGAIVERLAELTTRFSQNVLADESELPTGPARRARSRRSAGGPARRRARGGAGARRMPTRG